jgi:hypothetical protein
LEPVRVAVCEGGIAMLRPKIHFEQVPVAIAKKVLAEELRKKQAAEQAQGSKKDELEEAPLASTTVED